MKYYKGDLVKYIGRVEEFYDKLMYIEGIKAVSSEDTGRPIYYVRFEDKLEPYEFGIHERNLELVKTRPHDWEIV